MCAILSIVEYSLPTTRRLRIEKFHFLLGDTNNVFTAIMEFFEILNPFLNGEHPHSTHSIFAVRFRNGRRWKEINKLVHQTNLSLNLSLILHHIENTLKTNRTLILSTKVRSFFQLKIEELIHAFALFTGADKDVFYLRISGKHHFVGFTTNTGSFITTEWCAGR